MTTASWLFVWLCAWLMVAPLLLVFNREYGDGIIGRAGLLGISFTAATFVSEVITGTDYHVLPQTVLLIASFTVYLTWHIARFYCRRYGLGLMGRGKWRTALKEGADDN